MKNSIYEMRKQEVKGFSTPKEAYDYYKYLLDNNPESSVYPESLREFDKGLVMGLAAYLEKKDL